MLTMQTLSLSDHCIKHIKSYIKTSYDILRALPPLLPPEYYRCMETETPWGITLTIPTSSAILAVSQWVSIATDTDIVADTDIDKKMLRTSQHYLLNGKNEGCWRDWYINGLLRMEGFYTDGKCTGRWRSWYDSGRLYSYSNYTDVSKHTSHSWYKYENGNPMGEGYSISGKHTGHWRYWFSNGNPSEEGYYMDGKRTGYWRFFNESGQLHEEGSYANDKAIGHWRFFGEDGQLLKETDYY